MSWYRSRANRRPGFNPGPMLKHREEFPWDFLVGDYTANWWTPLQFSVADGMQLWWKVRDAEAVFSINDGAVSYATTVPLSRKFYPGEAPVTDEVDLNNPRINITDEYNSPDPCPCLYTGEVDDGEWDGPGSDRTVTIAAYIGGKRAVSVNGISEDIDHAVWAPDADGIAPSIYVTLGYSYATNGGGIEATLDGTNAPETGFQSYNLDFLPSHGGGLIPFNLDGTFASSLVSFSLTLKPRSASTAFWSWSGKYNTTTGAKLTA